VSRSLNKEIISTSCIILIILLYQAFSIIPLKAENRIKINKKIIVIDPGHGGEDSGIIVNNSLSEKSVTLKIARLTAKLLKEKYKIFLTRHNDLSLSPLKRTAFANIHKPDIFISIHAMKKINEPGSFIIFCPPIKGKLSQNNPSYAWEKEQLKHIKQSKAAAEILSAAFSKKFKKKFFIVSAPAIVLQGAQMPAVLIEVLPMEQLMGETNKEEILLSHAQAIAESLKMILK